MKPCRSEGERREAGGEREERSGQGDPREERSAQEVGWGGGDCNEQERDPVQV